MFTGIIEEIGTIKKITRTSKSIKLVIQCSKITDTVKNGDSVAVNGVCLTVSSFEKNSLNFDVMAESLKKTTNAKLKINDRVNLERAMPASGRLDGHFVQGHIDCAGMITSKIITGKTVYLEIKFPAEFSMYIAPRGSVAIDGVSLTVAEKNNNTFKVALVEFTQNNCALPDKPAHSNVNIEFDIIGKYLYEFYKKRDIKI